jgi:TetR/AcrR family transcriptional repressor of nem operon
MVPKVAGKQDTKTILLEAGMELMLQKGYSNTGIQEVLQAAQVPKGSFYHHFDSKENFAVAIIHFFNANYATEIFNILNDKERTPLQRLRDYCENSKAKLSAQECRKGCLIGNLSQEMSDQSEILRKELSIVMNKWRDMFAECIKEGQKANEIPSRYSAYELAEFFHSAWSGAVMKAKTEKTTESLDVFIKLMFEDILITE